MANLLRTLVLFVALLSPLHAKDIVYTEIPDAQVVGSGTLQRLVWTIYDVTLYAPKGKWQGDQPFALQFVYERMLKGGLIAKQSVDEIRKLGFDDEKVLDNWFVSMRKIFPDVKKGSELTGIYVPNQPTQFYQGSKKLGQIDNPEFGKWFFGIWLSEKSSESELRRQLLGLP